jgi:hypothetical protein
MPARRPPSESWGQARRLPRSRSRKTSVLSLTSSTMPESTSPGEGSRATQDASLHGPQRTEISSPPPVFLTRHPPDAGSILRAVSSEPKTGSVRGHPPMSRVRISISLTVSFTMSQCHNTRPATGALSIVEPHFPIPAALFIKLPSPVSPPHGMRLRRRTQPGNRHP